jgi:hypothetical protein
MKRATWTLRQALFCLIGSSLATLSISIGGYAAWAKHRRNLILDEKHRIVTIVQTGSVKEALKTAYLAEILGLSVDRSISLYAFDCRLAEKTLRASPLIKSALVKRAPPGGVYIDYEVRRPVAILADYKNVAIDEEGYLFPFAPFFSPKAIPEIYLGLPPFGAGIDALGRIGGRWLVPLQDPFVKIAMEVLHFLEETPWREGFRPSRIDVSNAAAPSLGQREIVIFTEEECSIRGVPCSFPKILRLAPQDFREQLSHFFALRRNIEEDYRKQLSSVARPCRFSPRIVDLRIPQLAFVQNQD